MRLYRPKLMSETQDCFGSTKVKELTGDDTISSNGIPPFLLYPKYFHSLQKDLKIKTTARIETKEKHQIIKKPKQTFIKSYKHEGGNSITIKKLKEDLNLSPHKTYQFYLKIKFMPSLLLEKTYNIKQEDKIDIYQLEYEEDKHLDFVNVFENTVVVEEKPAPPYDFAFTQTPNSVWLPIDHKEGEKISSILSQMDKIFDNERKTKTVSKKPSRDPMYNVD
jgi:hypothetical protein